MLCSLQYSQLSIMQYTKMFAHFSIFYLCNPYLIQNCCRQIMMAFPAYVLTKMQAHSVYFNTSPVLFEQMVYLANIHKYVSCYTPKRSQTSLVFHKCNPYLNRICFKEVVTIFPTHMFWQKCESTHSVCTTILICTFRVGIQTVYCSIIMDYRCIFN